MSYSSTVPTTGHSGSQDYTQMRENFAQIQTSFKVNHKPLASGGGSEGFHTVVQFPAVIADPGLASPQSSLYIKTISAASELFFQNGALAADVVQLSGNIVSASGNDGAGGSYTTFQLPYGFRIFAGTAASASGSRNLTLSGGTLFGGSVYCNIASATGGGGVACAITITAGTGNFNITSTNSAAVSWFAITT